MSQELYSLVGVSVNGTFIPADNHSLPDGITEESLMSGIDFYPTWVAPRVQKPIPTISTKAVGTALGVCGFGGLAITTVIFYYGKRDVLGWASGSVHKSVTLNDGLIVLNRLGWRGEDPASADFSFYAIHDGTNSPYMYADAVALPSTDSIAEAYYGGPVKLSSLKEVQGWEYSANWDIEFETHSGLLQPRFAAIRGGKPQFSVTTRDADLLDLLDQTGSLIGAADLTPNFFLRKGSTTGRVADATEEHISIMVNACYAKPGSQDGDNNASNHNIVFFPKKGGSALLTTDFTAAVA